MNITDYSTDKLVKCLEEYRTKLAYSLKTDKRYKHNKLNIVFNKAMVTLFETELASRLPF